MPDSSNANVIVASIVGVLGSIGALLVQARKDQATVDLNVKNAVLAAEKDRLKEELDECESELKARADGGDA